MGAVLLSFVSDFQLTFGLLSLQLLSYSATVCVTYSALRTHACIDYVLLPNLLPLHFASVAMASVAEVWRRDPHKAQSDLEVC